MKYQVQITRGGTKYGANLIHYCNFNTQEIAEQYTHDINVSWFYSNTEENWDSAKYVGEGNAAPVKPNDLTYMFPYRDEDQ